MTQLYATLGTTVKAEDYLEYPNFLNISFSNLLPKKLK